MGVAGLQKNYDLADRADAARAEEEEDDEADEDGFQAFQTAPPPQPSIDPTGYPSSSASASADFGQRGWPAPAAFAALPILPNSGGGGGVVPLAAASNSSHAPAAQVFDPFGDLVAQQQNQQTLSGQEDFFGLGSATGKPAPGVVDAFASSTSFLTPAPARPAAAATASSPVLQPQNAARVNLTDDMDEFTSFLLKVRPWLLSFALLVNSHIV